MSLSGVLIRGVKARNVFGERKSVSIIISDKSANPITAEPQNNGHVGDKNFVHCSEVVPSSEVGMYGQ